MISPETDVWIIRAFWGVIVIILLIVGRNVFKSIMVTVSKSRKYDLSEMEKKIDAETKSLSNDELVKRVNSLGRKQK